MKTPKKVWKDVAGKLKNRKSISSAKAANVEESRASDTPADVEEVKIDEEEKTSFTETDTQLCEDINENSEGLNIGQPMWESREELQNASIDTTAQEPNTPDNPSSAEPCFDSKSGKRNSVDEKSSKKAIQPIVAGIAGVVLLVSCVASYLLIEHSKMHVIAVVGGIVVLAIISFALYDLLKPSTKIDKVESAEQQDVHSALNPT